MHIRFDPEWKTNGYDQKVVELFTQWVAAQAVPGLTCEVLQEPNRTPLIFIEVPATGGEGGTVLMLVSSSIAPSLLPPLPPPPPHPLCILCHSTASNAFFH